jgi:hypothetical protein
MDKVALKHISDLVNGNHNTNIILLSAPHRHDLMEFSCVNNEIKVFNRKLKKYIKTSKHSLVVEINHKREFFTKHGFHLNGRGKEVVAKHLAMQISTILGNKIECPLSVGWKSDLGKEDSTRLLDNRNVTLKNRVNVINQGVALDFDETNVYSGVDSVKLPRKQPSPSWILDKSAENIPVKRSKKKAGNKIEGCFMGNLISASKNLNCTNPVNLTKVNSDIKSSVIHQSIKLYH